MFHPKNWSHYNKIFERMKLELLKVVRANLVELVSSGCLPRDVARLHDRLASLLRRHNGEIRHKLESELNLIFSNQVCPSHQVQQLVDDLDEFFTTFNLLAEYLWTAFSVGSRHSADLVEFLNSMVAQGIPVQIEPPLKSITTSFRESLTLTVRDACATHVSTPELFEIIAEKFEPVAEKAAWRPKIWVFPTIRGGRIIVGLGGAKDLESILVDVLKFLDNRFHHS